MFQPLISRFCFHQVHQKLAINCAVNPCTALLGCLNHEYSGSSWGRQLVTDVCKEMVELYGSNMLGVDSAEELTGNVLKVSLSGRMENILTEPCLYD